MQEQIKNKNYFILISIFSLTWMIDGHKINAERKLSKLKNSSNILEQLKARREHCIENLLIGNINLNENTNDEEFHLDEDIESNRKRDILRYIQPEQPINLGELVTIIHHDHLDQDQQNSTEGNEER